MPQCPLCGADLADDYGMVTCPSCKAILFIDMEGNVQVSGEAEDHDQSESIEQASSPSQDFKFDPADFPFSEVSNEENEIVDSVSSVEGSILPEDEPIAPEESFSSAEALPPDSDVNIFQDHAEPPDLGPADDPLGLKEYANSEFSQGKDGNLLFRILISGIDTKEIREILREAIEDSRFAWNSTKIMASISKGALKIENVSPVKAAILINRIKRLPLQIRWEQYAITQMEDFEGP